MMKYITDKNGMEYKIDFFETISNGRIGYYLIHNGAYDYHRTKVHYRPERTWDDHMGNTDCGYYTIVPLLTGERKRVYIF